MVFFAGGEAENSDTMSDESGQSWYQRIPFMYFFQDSVGVINPQNHAKNSCNMA